MRFKQLNQNVNNVISSLIQNQDLCKFLYYDTNNPLVEANIVDTSKLIFDKIYPIPKLPNTETEAGSFLNVFFDAFKIPQSNSGTKESVILFNIICHIDLWRMKGTGMLRPYSILHEIDEMFNNQKIIGIKKLQFDKGRFLYVNDKFSGYQASYLVTSVN
jgi:hypothetical protein